MPPTSPCCGTPRGGQRPQQNVPRCVAVYHRDRAGLPPWGFLFEAGPQLFFSMTNAIACVFFDFAVCSIFFSGFFDIHVRGGAVFILGGKSDPSPLKKREKSQIRLCFLPDLQEMTM